MIDDSRDHAVTFRIGIKDDIDTIAAFNVAMAHETEDIELDIDRVRKGVTNLVEHPERGFYTVAVASDRVVGCCLVTSEWSDWRNGMFWWIQSVYVIPEFRRKGVFTGLYGHVKDLAEKDGTVCGFRLYVERENTAAQRTYKSMGMKETYYRMFEEEF